VFQIGALKAAAPHCTHPELRIEFVCRDGKKALEIAPQSSQALTFGIELRLNGL